MANFLAILELELCAFYIKYKKVKFIVINFRGRTNVKYFMQTQLLQFCKDTAKVSSLPLLKIITNSTHFFQCCRLNFKQIKYKKPQNITSKHRAAKNLETAKTFFVFFFYFFDSKNFSKNKFFLLQSSFLSIYLHKSIHKK